MWRKCSSRAYSMCKDRILQNSVHLENRNHWNERCRWVRLDRLARVRPGVIASQATGRTFYPGGSRESGRYVSQAVQLGRSTSNRGSGLRGIGLTGRRQNAVMLYQRLGSPSAAWHQLGALADHGPLALFSSDFMFSKLPGILLIQLVHCLALGNCEITYIVGHGSKRVSITFISSHGADGRPLWKGEKIE